MGLSLQGSDVGFDRLIKEPTINRPGLVLAGFYTYFAFKRIQVIGNSENSYLKSLTASQRTKQFTDLCNRKIPCIVISRGYEIPKELLEIAERKGISILKTPSPVVGSFVYVKSPEDCLFITLIAACRPLKLGAHNSRSQSPLGRFRPAEFIIG